MYSVKNFLSNDDVVTIGKKGCFTALEYTKDLSVTPKSAIQAYFCSKMNIRKRQVVCDLKNISCDSTGRCYAVVCW